MRMTNDNFRISVFSSNYVYTYTEIEGPPSNAGMDNFGNVAFFGYNAALSIASFLFQ